MSPLTLLGRQVGITSIEASIFCLLSPWKQGSVRKEGSRADVGREPADPDERETKKREERGEKEKDRDRTRKRGRNGMS